MEPVRQKRLVSNLNANSANTTKFLSEKLHVISAEDVKFVSALALHDLYQENGKYYFLFYCTYIKLSIFLFFFNFFIFFSENQICFSETTFYLQNIITAMFFFTSCIVIISFWIKLKKLTEKSQILFWTFFSHVM